MYAGLQFERYKKWESGENQIPTTWIPVLCKHLHCDVGYLFGEYKELTWQNADIHAKTGLSEDAIHVLESLKVALGNKHFVSVEHGQLCKQEILNRIIEDLRFIDLLQTLKTAKLIEFQIQNENDSEFTGLDLIRAEQVFNSMNMVALKEADAATFYLQKATKLFTDIVYAIPTNFSPENAYSTEMIDLDKKTPIPNR